MAQKYLTILEVSQKQAFIFSSNRLKRNIENSDVIAWVTDPEYFESEISEPELFSIEKNTVYSGGGHTVLEFEGEDKAIRFTQLITKAIHKEFSGLEIFTKTISYDESKQPGENLSDLIGTLERKKAIRVSAFHQGSFGIEKIDRETMQPCLAEEQEKSTAFQQYEKRIEETMEVPGYKEIAQLEKLGGSKDISNFIAIVHIDGNAMGKRVESLDQKNPNVDWETYRKLRKDFSEAIDKDFKSAYKEMVECVVKNIEDGNLNALDLKEKMLPVRRLITAGDDICFVTEGRIGIECANIFIKKLNQKINAIDHEGYAACAGVAIVHRKYPFYKAYELAEMLCSNAKKFGAGIDREGLGKNVSAIDWHIEFGEMKDTLEEIRKNYVVKKEGTLELRPYIITAAGEQGAKEPLRRYENFRKLISKIQRETESENSISYARGKLKTLRSVLKQGENEAFYFMKANHMDSLDTESYYDIFEKTDYSQIGKGEERKGHLFIKTADGVKRSILFDAIEAVDTFIRLEMN